MIKTSSVRQYTEDQRDCLQEICNIVTGQTADVLARKLDAFVTLPIPEIKIIDADNLARALRRFDAGDSVYFTSQSFSESEGERSISGLVLVLLHDHCVDGLKEHPQASKSPGSIAQDICQPMVATCLEALSEQGELILDCDTPQFVGIEKLDNICGSLLQGWREILLVEMHYQLENGAFEGDLLLLFRDQSVITMAHKLDKLLDF